MVYDSIDLEFTWDGDYTIGDDGDLGDTSDDYIVSLIQEVQTVIKSEFGDWEKFPTLGADLSDFNGEPNTKATAKRITDRVTSKLTAIGLVKAEDLTVKIIPVGTSQVLISIRIQATPTPNNSLQLGQPVVVSLVYDSSEQGIFFLPDNVSVRDNTKPVGAR